MTDRCEDCLYFRQLKHNFTVGKGYEEAHCCIALLHIDGDDGWVQEVSKNGMCEMYERRIRRENVSRC